jgi:plasmid stabilization system protein ParE
MKLVWRHSAELQLRAQLQFIKAANPQAELRVRRRIQQRLVITILQFFHMSQDRST